MCVTVSFSEHGAAIGRSGSGAESSRRRFTDVARTALEKAELFHLGFSVRSTCK